MTKQYKNKLDKVVFTAVVSAINMTKDLPVNRQDLKPYIITALVDMLDMELFNNFIYINNLVNKILADENLL